MPLRVRADYDRRMADPSPDPGPDALDAAGDVALVDVGDDRRLDALGEHLVDRPSGGAPWPPRDPAGWAAADLRYDPAAGPAGRWASAGPLPQRWVVSLAGLRIELRPAAGGQVGLFAEHAAHWPWLADRIAARAPGAAPVRVLHLFAYTGATTLALARAGAAVAHVDASRPAVAWARRNASLSALDAAPIRWLVDDAAAFVAREARRGTRYAGIVLDPPSYGHGPGGRPWRLVDDLDALLVACAAITGPGAFVLLTAHTQGEDAGRLAGRLAGAFDVPAAAVDAGPQELVARSGARLRAGSFARIMGDA